MPTVLLEILMALCSVIIIKDVLLTLLFTKNFKASTESSSGIKNLPFVSVLLAVRNEQFNIKRCLESLELQDYPVDRYEILVGNDRSEDDTLGILLELESLYKNLSIHNIEKLVQSKHGKMNVLAQLGELAKGDILLFTDADTSVPETWIRCFVQGIQEGDKGIVTGTTLLETNMGFGKLQRIEWAHAIGMMKVVSDLDFSVSSIGNNMAISRDAYNAVGGFKGIPFSITEDYEIFRQICNKGYSSFHIFEKPILAFSLPSSSVWELLIQRKRWMLGAFRLPVPMLLLLILNTLYYPIIIVIIFFDLNIGLTLALVKIFMQGIFIKMTFRRLEERASLSGIFLYEFYAALINLWAFLVFLLPIRITWKGRTY